MSRRRAASASRTCLAGVVDTSGGCVLVVRNSDLPRVFKGRRTRRYDFRVGRRPSFRDQGHVHNRGNWCKQPSSDRTSKSHFQVAGALTHCAEVAIEHPHRHERSPRSHVWNLSRSISVEYTSRISRCTASRRNVVRNWPRSSVEIGSKALASNQQCDDDRFATCAHLTLTMSSGHISHHTVPGHPELDDSPRR